MYSAPCPQCGEDIPSSSRICLSCLHLLAQPLTPSSNTKRTIALPETTGTPVYIPPQPANPCPQCGEDIPSSSKICLSCLYLPTEQTTATDITIHHKLRERYHLQKVLGSGGFATVYQAFDTQTLNTVAVKCINLYNLPVEQAIDATATFNREIELLSRLAHPQIPRIYDHFSDANHWYLVMQFMTGTSLETYVQRHGVMLPKSQSLVLPLAEVLKIGCQLCIILDYLHSQSPSIIYRDLKPGNIIYHTTNLICLVDFGSSRFYRPGQRKDTIPLGSPGYAPPEQYGRAQTTPQSDIYSLGAVLHQLITGEDPSISPFHFTPLPRGKDPMQSKLAYLITRMISRDPQQRPHSARAVLAELQSLQAQNHKPNVPGFLPKWLQPRPVYFDL